ncbi:GntR family transcriptional regulator, partial [Streptomyces sp. SID5606]|uniref:winged helix-turn-helix domain-containing protein n=1 Tax=Streptomyces sp. SID5606 TaxID=2690305 RepID=UPI0013701E75
MDRTTPHDDPLADGRPLYWRVAARLLDELHDGSVPPGGRLPGERRLAENFGVSRETVRQALDVLRRDGLLSTDRRGSHAALPGPPARSAAPLAFPVGARPAEPRTGDRAT